MARRARSRPQPGHGVRAGDGATDRVPAKGADSRVVADAKLNLPAGKYSHGLGLLAAQGAGRGSFEQAQAAIAQATGVKVGKRQVEALTAAADDVDGLAHAIPS